MHSTECKDTQSFYLCTKAFKQPDWAEKPCALCNISAEAEEIPETWFGDLTPTSKKKTYKLLRTTKISHRLSKLELNLHPFTSATVFWMWEKHVGICFSTDSLLYCINDMGQWLTSHMTPCSPKGLCQSWNNQAEHKKMQYKCKVYVWGVGSKDGNKRHLSRNLFTHKLLFLGITIFVLQFTCHSRLPRIALE